MLVDAAVLTWGAEADRVGFAGEEETIGGDVVKGVVTAVVAIRAMRQRKKRS